MIPLYTFHLVYTTRVLCNFRNQWRTLEAHMMVSLWPPIPYLEPSLFSSFGDSLRFIACSPSGIIHQISDFGVNIPARAENTALRCFFFLLCLIFKLAIRNGWNEECVAQTPRGSTVCFFALLFPSNLFLCLSQTVTVSVCGRGKASFSMAHHSL